jgi:hypothetical protein
MIDRLNSFGPLRQSQNCRERTAPETFCGFAMTSRFGITLMETLVAMILLTAVLSMTTTACSRIQQIWKSIAYQRVATIELSNQIEALTRLTRAEVEPALEHLEVSPECRRTLLQPTLLGRLATDELGTRIELRLTWQSHPTPLSIEMAGWLIESRDSANQDTSANQTPETPDPPDGVNDPHRDGDGANE